MLTIYEWIVGYSICNIFVVQDENADGAEDGVIDISDTLQQDATTLTQQPKKRSAASFLSKNKNKKNANEELMLEATRALKCASAIPVELTQNSEREVLDEFDIFGKHVANEMRIITDFRARQYVKLQIQNLLFEAQFVNHRQQPLFSAQCSPYQPNQSYMHQPHAEVPQSSGFQSTGLFHTQSEHEYEFSVQGTPTTRVEHVDSCPSPSVTHTPSSSV